MRITGGIYRGRILKAPTDLTIRPTSDKVRQAIFNILNARGLIQEAVVVDAFCGTGALGLEALSQGAFCCTFIDKNRRSLSLAEENFAALNCDTQHNFLLRDAAKPGLKPQTVPAATLVFLDPPYKQDLIVRSVAGLAEAGWLAPACHLLIECERSYQPEELAGLGCDIILTRDYGDTRIALARLSDRR